MLLRKNISSNENKMKIAFTDALIVIIYLCEVLCPNDWHRDAKTASYRLLYFRFDSISI